MTAVTHDTVFGGRVKLVQPQTGFRAGTDSLLLAAAITASENHHALELGCGSGGALLPCAFRLAETRFTGVEMDPIMADLARAGVEANAFGDRVRIETGEASDWVKTHENTFDIVFANPPYFEAGKISGPGDGKPTAYIETLDLSGWIKAMIFAAKPRAPIVMIHRAAELARLLAAFDRGCGDIHVLPIASKPGEEARRVLVRARKGLKRGPMRLLAPLVLHETDGGPSDALKSLRNAEPLYF